MHSNNITGQNIDKIAELFPNCITESIDKNGKLTKAIDFDLLKQELSTTVVEGQQERYQLSWPGKREALLTANAPIAKTLRPCREESVNFDTTENLFIEGDNLDALKLLQETYLGKVKMIYIDPPYNTGKDFIYSDKFTQNTEEYLQESNQVDEEGNRLITNSDSNGRFHSDWLSMMYSRLKLARNLLKDDGVLFISIGEAEVSNIEKLGNEVFGETNFIGIVPRVMKSGGNKGRFFSPNIDYILIFAKDISNTNDFKAEMDEELIKKLYTKIQNTGERKGEKYRPFGLYQSSLDARPNQRFYIECPDGSFAIPPGNTFPKKIQDGEKVLPEQNDGCWRWSADRYLLEKTNDNIIFIESPTGVLVTPEGKKSKWNVYTKIWLKERQEEGQTPNNFITKFENRHSANDLKIIEISFDFSKPVNLIKYLITICGVKQNEIVCDFFAGSSTTAHAALQRNAENGIDSKFIMVQLPEECNEKSDVFKAGFKNIAEISKERIRRAGKKIVEGECHNNWNKDIGFRVLKVDTSNMEDVHYNPDNIGQGQLLGLSENIKSDRTEEDLLFQVLLDWGVDLTLPITFEEIDGNKVYCIDNNALCACFNNAGSITESFVQELAKREPLRVVFRDSGFKSDDIKINVGQIFKQMSPHTEVKTI